MVNFVYSARSALSRQQSFIIRAGESRAARRVGVFAADPQTAAFGLVRG